MNTFPTLSTSPNADSWVEEYSDEAVERSNYASGYPLVNSVFTFDPKNFSFVLEYVSEADKEAIDTFYENNKASAFYWLNPHNSKTYQVIFKSKPNTSSMLSDTPWRIQLSFRQANSEVS